MPHPTRSRLFAVGVVLPLLLAAGCGGKDGDKDKEAAKAGASSSCDSAVLSGKPATALPSGFPALSGATVYKSVTQGKTTDFLAAVPGGTAEIVSVRDQAASALKDAGYEIEGTDQEPGAEAEAEFKGTHEGSIQVQPLCEGKLRLRYRLHS